VTNPFAQGVVASEIWFCLISVVVPTSDLCDLSQVNYLLAHISYQRNRTTVTGQQSREDENLQFHILNCSNLYLGEIWKWEPEKMSGKKEFFFIKMPSDGQW